MTPKAKLERLHDKAWGYPGAADDADALEQAIHALGDQPPIAGEADQEYSTRIDADRCTLQFGDALRPRKPQAAVDDLPLFGGERQGGLF